MPVATPIKIGAELIKATKYVLTKKRQTDLRGIVKKCNELSDAKYDALSKDAQLWLNKATKAYNANTTIPDYDEAAPAKAPATTGKPTRRAAPEPEPEDDEEADEEAADEEEADEEADEPEEDAEEEADEPEEAPPPRRRRAAPEPEPEDDEEEEADEEEPADDADEEEAEEEADEDEAEADEPPPRRRVKETTRPAATKPTGKAPAAKAPATKPKAADATGEAPTLKDRIKLILIEDPNMSNVDLIKKLGKVAKSMSSVTIANTRSDFRHSLKLLKREGKLRGVAIT